MSTIKRSPCQFPKAYRLNTPETYRRVFAKPRKLYIKGLTILYRENGLTHARLGLAIAKKHAKLAVVRNRLRRLIRENFRLHSDQIAGFDVVVLANKNIEPHSLDSWLQELPHQWQLLAKRQKKLLSS